MLNSMNALVTASNSLTLSYFNYLNCTLLMSDDSTFHFYGIKNDQHLIRFNFLTL